MILSKRDFTNLMGINSNEHENGELLLSKQIINEKSVVIDVGARDSELPYVNDKATYYLFEPIKFNYDNLTTKFKDFKNVKINKLCLSDCDEIVEIYKESESINRRHNFNYIWEIVNPSRVHDGITEKIECVTLNDYLTSNNINSVDLLTIDVEGYEFKVIKGLGDKVKNVKNIIFEYAIGTYSSSGIELSQLLELLKDFEFYLIQDDGVIKLNLQEKSIYDMIRNTYYCNILAINKNNG